MAFIPDEAALAMRSELSSPARDLFVYYCVRRNRKTGGFNCPPAKVLQDLKGLSRSAYFRAKSELERKGWIEIKGDSYIYPLKGFDSPDSGTQSVPVVGFDSPDSGTQSPTSGTEQSQKWDSYIRNTSQLPAIRTSQLPPGADGLSNGIPKNSSIDSQVNVWLTAIAPLLGAKSVETLPREWRWREAIGKAVREQRSLIEFMSIVTAERERTKENPAWLTADNCLAILQAKTGVPEQKKYNGRALGEFSR